MQNIHPLSPVKVKAIRVIRNFLTSSGSFPSVRQLMNELGYKSPRSAALIVEQLEEEGVLKRMENGSYHFNDITDITLNSEQTIDVPIIGIVACGQPIFAKENITATIPVSVKLAKPPHKYFFLQAKGDSMNEVGINDGDLVLVKQQVIANNGDIVVALIDDEATIKEFHRQSDVIVLRPRSKSKKHQPILLTTDFRIQGVVITSIADV